MTLADLQAGVRRKIGNRQDQNSNLNLWLAAAIRELTQDYSFTELQDTPAVGQFTAGQSVYDLNAFTNGNDWSRITSWKFYYNGQTGPSKQIDGRELKVVEQMCDIPGIPCYYAVRNSTNIVVGFNPTISYYTLCSYQKVHPFSNPPANGDTVYMPDSWKEVIEYAGAIRGCSELRQIDYVNMYTNMIHGDELWRTSNHVKGKPGIIFGLVSKMQRVMDNSTRRLNVVVQRY